MLGRAKLPLGDEFDLRLPAIRHDAAPRAHGALRDAKRRGDAGLRLEVSEHVVVGHGAHYRHNNKAASIVFFDTVVDVSERDDLSTIGKRLRYARKRIPLTQIEASKRAGITQGSLSPLESDETKEPKATTVMRLARAYGVNQQWLLTGVGNPDEPDVDATPSQVAELMGQMTPGNRRRLLALASSLLADQLAEAAPRKPSVADPFPGVPKPVPLAPARRRKPVP